MKKFDGLRMEKYNFYTDLKSVKEQARENMSSSWGYFAMMCLMFLVMCLVVIGIAVTLSLLYPFWYVIIPLSVISLWFLAILVFGWQTFCFNMANKMKADTKDLFSGFGRKTFRLFKLLFIKLIAFAFALVLLIFPAIRLYLEWNFSSYLLIDNSKIKAFESLKKSKKLLGDNKMRLFKFLLSFTGLFILGIASAGIGLLWVLPYFEVSKIIFYEDLKTEF